METLALVLKITLVLFMVGNLLDMGLRLKIADALRGLRDIRFVACCLLWGFVLLPALAVLLSRVIPIEPAYATGLVLLGMTPCAPFLPPMVDRARGDIGYTAAFMLLMSVATVAYLPVAVPLLAKGLTADAWTIAKPLVLFLLVPLAVGVAIRQRSEALADRLHPVVKTITGIDTIIMLVLCIVIYGEGFLSLVGSEAIGAQVAFFLAATLLPYVIGFGLPRAQRVVVSLGMATRNLGAAFAPLFAIPGVDHRAIVMVALGVVMQTMFSFAAATVYGRQSPAGLENQKR